MRSSSRRPRVDAGTPPAELPGATVLVNQSRRAICRTNRNERWSRPDELPPGLRPSLDQRGHLVLCGTSVKSRYPYPFRWGTWRAYNFDSERHGRSDHPLIWGFPVVGTGVDPVTSRFSDRRSGPEIPTTQADVYPGQSGPRWSGPASIQ